jgi:glycosyltransferase involved in cell wall biosynthesis
MRWVILSGTYAGVGGVSDYTRQVATELAAIGDEVAVCAPSDRREQLNPTDIRLVQMRSGFGALALSKLDRTVASLRPDRLLVQYVPHAFGCRAMNIPFCVWLYARRRRYPIYVMFHEVAVAREAGQPLRHKVRATVTQLMARLAARAASRIFISTLAWERMLRPMVPNPLAVTWLPIPSNIPVVKRLDDASRIKMSYATNGEVLIGHLGTYGGPVAQLLMAVLPLIVNAVPDRKILLIGLNSERFAERFLATHSGLAARLQATGPLSATNLSCHLTACDVMLQPYPDGITTRRTSAMASLSHGIPLVTTKGRLTEPLWEESGAVLLSPVDSPEHLAHQLNWLIDDAVERRRLAAAGRALYENSFALTRTLTALRRPLDVLPRS